MSDGGFKAHYWRHAVDHVQSFDYLEAAIGCLESGEEAGTTSACCVTFPDGTRRAYHYGSGLQAEPSLPLIDHFGEEML